MSKKKINLIYIASNGRSGSTLLDLLLGGLMECWTLGEFQILPWEIKDHLQSCGCGKQVEECLFWQPIMRCHQHLLEQGDIHRFRQSHGVGKVLRWNELFAIWTKRNLKHGCTRLESIHEYGKQNSLIMEDILLQAKKAKGDQVLWLVDASKDPYRLSWLAQSGMFNLKVIHLVKDPRAFVYSMVKGRTWADSIKTALRMAIRYVVENYIIDLVIKRAGMDVISSKTWHAERERSSSALLLRYEDLAGNPQKTIESVCSWLGNCTPIDVNAFRTITQHAVSGNKMRMEKRDIFLDEKWKASLPYYLQRSTEVICRPMATRYQYFSSPSN